jgi:CheY-like chemotaxis protein
VRANLGDLVQQLHDHVSGINIFNPTSEQLATLNEDLEALDSIYQCGLAQERIANDVLSLSRIQLQVLPIHPAEFHLVKEVTSILSIFKNELKMKKIKLDLSFGNSIERLDVRCVFADKARFAQVITNLMVNAMKFTNMATKRRNIWVKVEVSNAAPETGASPPLVITRNRDPSAPIYIFVSVEDTGPGLTKEDLEVLFKRFQQGSTSQDVFGGSGLGLFVSRKLCELMNGRIDVSSKTGGGAKFEFFIEAKRVHSDSPPTNLSSLPQRVESPTTKHPYHVLITEDNSINQTILNRQLKKAGCMTTLASNGLEALEEIKKLAKSETEPRKFDVILMDCEMPVMSGLTATGEIRKMEASGEIPGPNRILALTGNARAGQIQAALDSGMDDVIMKPYKLEDLLQKFASD